MWFRQKKTARIGKPMNQAQRKAWIENWTIWVLLGAAGTLQNIIYQAAGNKVPSQERLKTLIIEMKIIISDIRAKQAARKAEKK